MIFNVDGVGVQVGVDVGVQVGVDVRVQVGVDAGNVASTVDTVEVVAVVFKISAVEVYVRDCFDGVTDRPERMKGRDYLE